MKTVFLTTALLSALTSNVFAQSWNDGPILMEIETPKSQEEWDKKVKREKEEAEFIKKMVELNEDALKQKNLSKNKMKDKVDISKTLTIKKAGSTNDEEFTVY